MVSTRRYIGVAALSALAAALLFFLFLQRLNARAAAAVAERREAVVVVKQAEPGQKITKDMVTLKMIFPADIPKDAITAVDEVVGKTASVRLYAGEVLISDRIGSVSRLSAAGSVPTGRVAFALSVKPHTGVAALIAPGDRVDILGRQKKDKLDGANSELRDPPLKILVANVRVVGEAGKAPLAEPLAPDAPTPTPQPPTAPHVFILDLTVEEAVIVADAVDTAPVYVALRSSQQ